MWSLLFVPKRDKKRGGKHHTAHFLTSFPFPVATADWNVIEEVQAVLNMLMTGRECMRRQFCMQFRYESLIDYIMKLSDRHVKCIHSCIRIGGVV